MFVCLDEAGRRKGSDDESHAHRLEFLWWQRARRESGPEAVAISGDGCKARDVTSLYQIIYLGALEIGIAVIATGHGGVPVSGPRLANACWKVLQALARRGPE